MTGQISINYEEVNTEVRRLLNHLNANIISASNTGYRQIRSELRQVDGAACASYHEIIDANQEKAAAAASVLERILITMSVASRQMQAHEQQIARSFNLIRR